MRPIHALGEFGQETSRSDCAAFAPTDIRKVSEIALELTFVFNGDRHMPATVICRNTSIENAVGKFVVVAHHRSTVMAQRDDASAGQCRDVNYCSRLESPGVGERVAENQPAFGIGIEDFDSLTVAGICRDAPNPCPW